jgi:tripartite-type tricarboxylate transporter receptor subunit TctC
MPRKFHSGENEIMPIHLSRRATVLGIASAAVAGPAFAQSAAEFFKDKTVTFYVGLSAGGGYDVNARLVAKHIGKYIPGNPQVIVRNMPGGGGLVMTNYVSNVAAKDGLHIGAPQRGIPFEPLLHDASNAKFDAVKLQWIGSVNSDTSVALVSSRTGVKVWQDLRTVSKDVIVAGTGVGTESVVVPYVLRNLLGFKYRVIAGYPGGSDMNIAMQRGETDGRGTFTWTSLKPHYKEWVESGLFNILYQQGLRKHPDLEKVPLVTDLTDDKEIRRLLEIQFTAFELGRPYFVSDGVPADRVAVLRAAFDKAMTDKDLIADATRQDLEVLPMTGQEMQKILADIYATPKDQIERLKEATKQKPDLKVLEGKGGGGKKGK